MKPIENKRTTPFGIGEFIVSKRHYGRGRVGAGYPVVYKIVGLSPCSFDPAIICKGCESGNIAYKIKRFNKRLGNKSWRVCPIRLGESEWEKWEPEEVHP